VAPDPHPLVGKAKHVAAGAVLIASVATAMLGLLVLDPPLWHRLF
jgi:diacylglycerol kinase